MRPTNPQELLVEIVKILDRLNIQYLVSGGMAVLVWGRPRFTADIDIVVELTKERLSKLEIALRQLLKSGYLDRETMVWAMSHQGEFNFIDGESGLKVDFWVTKDDPFTRSYFQRKVTQKVLGNTVYFISAEDLILVKLLGYKNSQSSRQFEDVESIFKISGNQLDKKYLSKWAQKLGLREILNDL